jgi:uncharacterized protein YdaU (DUF1376 family)
MAADLANVRNWMPFHLDLFFKDPLVATMHADVQGLYALLLLKLWYIADPVGSLVDDDTAIAAFVGVPVRQWNKVRAPIMACFKKGEDGRWHQAGMERVWAEQCDRYQQRISAAVRGGRTAKGGRRKEAYAQATDQAYARPNAQADGQADGTSGTQSVTRSVLTRDSLLERERGGVCTPPPLEGGAATRPSKPTPPPPLTAEERKARWEAEQAAKRAAFAAEHGQGGGE